MNSKLGLDNLWGFLISSYDNFKDFFAEKDEEGEKCHWMKLSFHEMKTFLQDKLYLWNGILRI